MNIQPLSINSKPKKTLSSLTILNKKVTKVQNLKIKFNDSFNKASKSPNPTMRDYLKNNHTV